VVGLKDGFRIVHDTIRDRVSAAVAEHGRAVEAHDSVLRRYQDEQELVQARDHHIRVLEDRNKVLEDRINWMTNSRSWRYTKWMRKAARRPPAA
jgi:hypothetical protein